MTSGRVRERFTGRIAGSGSTSGVRIVVGRWDDSPWGSFTDVMVEDASGHRVLLAPDERVREFVAATYSFDEQVIEPVDVVDSSDGWEVVTPSLSLRLAVGGRTALGAALGLVPARVATAPAWCAAIDPFARSPCAACGPAGQPGVGVESGTARRRSTRSRRLRGSGAGSTSVPVHPLTRRAGSASRVRRSGRR